MAGFTQRLDSAFHVTERGSTVGTEFRAGLTTFATMAYILIVNVDILSAAGLEGGAVFMATALGAIIGTVLMGLLAGLPLAQAPGMGLNAFFAYTVVLSMGYSPAFALAAVFVEGLIFIVLSLTKVRQKMFNAIPLSLKHAVSAGIGLFILFIGLQNSGIIVASPATIVAVNKDLMSPSIFLAIVGIAITIILYVKRVKGALLLGIVATWLLGIVAQLVGWYTVDVGAGVYSLLPDGIVSLPPSMAPTFGLFLSGFGEAFGSLANVGQFVVVVFTFLFVDMFDTIGTLSGVGSKANLLDKNGELPGSDKALLADAIATTAGAAMGTSTVTTFVESAAGVAEGGRTGLTAMSTALFFLLSIFFFPIVRAIPSFATASALVMVGIMMFEPLKEVDLSRPDHLIPTVFTVGMMVLGYSISDGLMWGILSYLLVKVCMKEGRKISPVLWVLGLLFIIRMFILT